jgi:hypothetical protein
VHHVYAQKKSKDEEEHKKKADHIVGAVLDRMDTDKDGRVSLEELVAVGLQGLPNFESMGAEGHHYDVESGSCPSLSSLSRRVTERLPLPRIFLTSRRYFNFPLYETVLPNSRKRNFTPLPRRKPTGPISTRKTLNTSPITKLLNGKKHKERLNFRESLWKTCLHSAKKHPHPCKSNQQTPGMIKC